MTSLIIIVTECGNCRQPDKGQQLIIRIVSDFSLYYSAVWVVLLLPYMTGVHITAAENVPI